MGVEYVEYKVIIRNKKTKKEIEISREMLITKEDPLYNSKDFEVIDLRVVYG